ncbi:MAG: SLBB domain-containing protein [Gammaproteobacteria bacterium]|nr:SLBB domain-containing protein [Gammaproteobacteria bacterium]
MQSRKLIKAMKVLTALAFSVLLVSNTATAQPSLTPAQIQQVQSLSDEERQALAQQAGAQPGERQQQIPEAVNLTPAADTAATQAEQAIEQDAQQRQQQDTVTTDQASQQTAQPLRQFGYELFSGAPSTFAPTTNIPVPSTYVMGPGDTVIIQLYGQRNLTHELVITREGMLMFPEIGPVSVAGLNFQELRDQIQSIVANQLIGQNASITLGALRSINVFVLGEAAQPGSYTVSSLSTMTNALFASGGVTRVGSLRSIRLMRSGELITELDLYDLLLSGDTSGDARLLPGDVIFIPPIGKTVGIAGEVRRPAIYELRDETSPAQILGLSGGLNPTAFPQASRIERINENGERIIVNVDLRPGSAPDPVLNDGDVIQVYSVLDQLENVVMLEGHVHRPGSFQWASGLRVSDVLGSVEEMLPNPDLEYALIAREIPPTRRIELLYVNLGGAISNPGGAQDLNLQPRDQLLTFGASQSRQDQVASLLERLREQATFENPPLIVTVSGNVRFPGEYPLVRDMSMDDAIRFAGGLGINTDLDYLLLERQIDRRGTIAVQASALNDQSLLTQERIVLQELDKVMVFNINQSRNALLAETLDKLRAQANSNQPTSIVNVGGNVRFPGNYPLQIGMTVSDLIETAGGFTESADITTAEVTRYDAEPDVGRIIGHVGVNLQTRGSDGLDLELNPFDQLTIRQMPNWTEFETVTIGGEVKSPGTYSITKEETLTSLIQRAGGLTEYAEPRAAIFLREELRVNEQRMLDEFRQRLQRDMVTQSFQSTEDAAAATGDIGQMLALVEQAEATGRLAIDLPAALDSGNRNNESYDVILRSGDRLLVPRTQQEVSVIGEVNRPTSHLFHRGYSVSDYIGRSGGYTSNADGNNVFIIKANGEVISYGDSRWFFQQASRLEPGDSIIVPFDARRTNYLSVWRNITQILFNISTTLLAIDSVGQ